MNKLYGIKRPDRTVVQDHDALGRREEYAALLFLVDNIEGNELIDEDEDVDIHSAVEQISDRGYSVVEVEIVEKKA